MQYTSVCNPLFRSNSSVDYPLAGSSYIVPSKLIE